MMKFKSLECINAKSTALVSEQQIISIIEDEKFFEEVDLSY